MAFALLALSEPSFSAQRVRLIPHLRAGQTFFYRIEFSNSRKLQTESRVTSPLPLAAESLNTSALLQVEVIESSTSGLHLKTYYSERQPAPAAGNSQSAASSAEPSADKVIEVTISADGAASQTKGFDQLSGAQQFAWNDWLGRFTSSMSYPRGGVHPGQKWETSELETTPSPIAGLVWTKKSQYVRDESCPVSGANPEKSRASSSSVAPESCAVFLLRATLRQKSSSKNSTPPDYKLRNLKTWGTASGQNESILYVSRTSGLLVRSTEDAQQSMDVVVALADGSNQVHNTLDARSHSEILLLSVSPQAAR